MTLCIENETEESFDFDIKDTAEAVAGKVLEMENCPYEVTWSLLLTDHEGIRELNRDYRHMDRPTDVLSFPNLNYEAAADFSHVEENAFDCFEPDTGELVLGDIVINVDQVNEQARKYGHSPRREFAFLVAHSMLHLLGYDHMAEEEAAMMERKQEQALQELGITRDEWRKTKE